jgi:lantibiotic transport system permease protein
MPQLIHSFRSEWLKTRRTVASWLTLGGAFLVPLIYLMNRLIDFDDLYAASQSKHLWERLFSRCWDITNVMLLPLGVILATSLIAQIEFRHTAWKQVLTTPQSLARVFFTKFFVVVVMLLQFFFLFNLGIYLCGIVPSIIFKGIPFPVEQIPYLRFLKLNLNYFLACMPILALQYLVSIHFKNFLVPLTVGIGLYVSSIIAVSWKYGYFIPYTYIIHKGMSRQSAFDPSVNLQVWAVGYFLLFTLLAYFIFIFKKVKG